MRQYQDKSSIERYIDKRARGGALQFGISVDVAADKDQIRNLLRTLRPVHNSKGLARFGAPADGGYLMPDDLEGVYACVSPGVADECRFDLAMSERGIGVYMADGAVDRPPIDHPGFHFVKKFFDIVNADDMITIDEFCRQLIPTNQANSDLILQMDIEGAEYSVLQSMSDELLKRFRIMIIEFHYMDQIFSRFGFKILRGVFKKLKIYHEIVHIHPNNCCGTAQFGEFELPKVSEFTYYRRDRALFNRDEILQYPHPLDVDNVPTEARIALPTCLRGY